MLILQKLVTIYYQKFLFKIFKNYYLKKWFFRVLRFINYKLQFLNLINFAAVSFNFEIIPLHQAKCDFFFKSGSLNNQNITAFFWWGIPLQSSLPLVHCVGANTTAREKGVATLESVFWIRRGSARFKFYDSVCEYRDDFFFEFSPGWQLKEMTVREEYSAGKIECGKNIYIEDDFCLSQSFF